MFLIMHIQTVSSTLDPAWIGCIEVHTEQELDQVITIDGVQFNCWLCFFVSPVEPHDPQIFRHLGKALDMTFGSRAKAALFYKKPGPGLC